MSEAHARLQADIDAIRAEALEAASAVEREADLATVRARFVGKKGAFAPLMQALGRLAPEDRPSAGARINVARDAVEAAFESARSRLAEAALAAALERGRVDVTLPGRVVAAGATHPVQQVLDDLVDLLCAFGFELADGPEVETETFNFDLLNMPSSHPARDMQDTFYLEGGLLLRTQTSPVQVRTMQSRQPPVRIIAPGKVFRCDADTTHSPVFHQIEGLWIDRDVTMADLKGTLTHFLRMLYGPDRPVRFRPSFFPFTEPSVELDVWTGSRWMEVLGAGMVHPQVLRNVGYDPDQVQGFAFGLGVDRLAMIRYGITDIRYLWENDARFLRQFPTR
ncbi:phenylalanine--tRNA ligase subunit alpha [Myxococcota bacterium]|nr:phenylalanine--tRNA ligase subunit alpha [Myxococcota bacterium]